MRKTLLSHLLALGYGTREVQTLVMSGAVTINGEIAIVPGTPLKTSDAVAIHAKTREFVSRAAHKLVAAIDAFNVDLTNKVVLDVGSSTGGFTQVALLNGARCVYALDVGTNQLDYRLRIDSRVVVHEQTNLKKITLQLFNPLPEIVVCDVSFISLKHLFRVLEPFQVVVIALIKPQYEASSNQVEPGGYVPPSLHEAIIAKVVHFAQALGFRMNAIIPSPVLGHVARNIEYLAHFTKESTNA